MRITFALFSLTTSFFMACGSSSTQPSPIGAGDDAGGDAQQPTSDGGGGDDGGTAFMTAPHTPFPPLQKHSAKVLSAPHVISITYANDANRATVDEFGGYIVTSNWMTTTGKDYGVGAGTHTAGHLTDMTPATITDAQATALIDQRITDGTLPALPRMGSQNIYVLYFPKGVKIDDGSGSILCSKTGAVGYHSTATHNGLDFVYAIVPDCTGKIDDLTSTATHEIMESATDAYNSPNDGWYVDPPLPSLWFVAAPNENGDLCQYEDNTTDGKWAVQRIWSMSAAAAGKSPCAPQVAGEVFYNTTSSPETIQKVPAGGSATFTMTGWSTAPLAPWKIRIDTADTTDFDPMAQLSASTISNGETVTVKLTAPAGMAAGKVGGAYVSSGPFFRFWPVAIQVQ